MFNFLKRSTYLKPKLQQYPQQSSADIDGFLIDIIIDLLQNKVSTVFDIGAHHGRYSTALNNKIPGLEIFCFEPFSGSYKILAQKLTSNNFHIYPLAISNIEGKMPFYSNQLDETNSLLPSSITNSAIDILTSNKTVVEVDVTTLDKFCFAKGVSSIDILKIDVQGNTLNVLKGAENLIKSKRVKIIQCEVEFLEIYKGQYLFHHITSYLETYNYSLYSLFNLHFDINNRLSWADAIYYEKHD